MQKITSKDIDTAIKRMAKSKDGKIFLHTLMLHCGYHKNLVSTDPSETQIYAAKRGVYGYFRKFIEGDSLIDIEHNIIVTHEKETK